MSVRLLGLIAIATAIVAIGLKVFPRTLGAQGDPWIPFRLGFIEGRIITAQAQIEDLRFFSSDLLKNLIFSANVKNLSDREALIRVSVAIFDEGYRLVCAGRKITEELGPRWATNVQISLGRCGWASGREGKIRFFQVAAFTGEIDIARLLE
jgi:hypothetical protein